MLQFNSTQHVLYTPLWQWLVNIFFSFHWCGYVKENRENFPEGININKNFELHTSHMNSVVELAFHSTITLSPCNINNTVICNVCTYSNV